VNQPANVFHRKAISRNTMHPQSSNLLNSEKALLSDSATDNA